MKASCPTTISWRSLMLGRAQMDFKKANGPRREAVPEIYEKLPHADAAPEALYWAGRLALQASNDSAALKGEGARVQDDTRIRLREGFHLGLNGMKFA